MKRESHRHIHPHRGGRSPFQSGLEAPAPDCLQGGPVQECMSRGGPDPYGSDRAVGQNFRRKKGKPLLAFQPCQPGIGGEGLSPVARRNRALRRRHPRLSGWVRLHGFSGPGGRRPSGIVSGNRAGCSSCAPAPRLEITHGAKRSQDNRGPGRPEPALHFSPRESVRRSTLLGGNRTGMTGQRRGKAIRFFFNTCDERYLHGHGRFERDGCRRPDGRDQADPRDAMGREGKEDCKEDASTGHLSLRFPAGYSPPPRRLWRIGPRSIPQSSW